MEEKDHRKELANILGIGNGLVGYTRGDDVPSWPRIYSEIGKLKERAEKPAEIRYLPSNNPMPLTNNPNLHYHGSSPCYNNPCIWA